MESSKYLMLGILLGALAGGASATLLTTKTGKKLKKDVTGKYDEIRGNIDDFIASLSKNVNKKTGAWADKAKETLEYIKEQTEDLSEDISDHKELGIGILLGALLGVAVGAGGVLARDKLSGNHEDRLHAITSKISSWKPILTELHNLFDKGDSSDEEEPKNDLLHFAATGLKLWNTFKKRK